ncbi:golgin subfamily A member 6-like protein 22 isoform X2 [Coccinella septempunctata]|uniref:golgin subfamily A member 6-like protein 22 isoform X2 n=1 Tax=Coccinella septempunctata TaxID=41139 RepID=UPI001D099306|nr:golgin subfamily A member 6-like protein 22 isoform X2 [Coccinella septempunctata]
MVYESDFYTTRRPYRYTPSYSTYTTSTLPSRQVRVLPGLGKVHIVHTYDRIVPYVGHKRLTVVTTPPKVYSTRPSILQREYDWIENRMRPWVAYSATNNYLNSNSAVRMVYIRNTLPISEYTNYYRVYRPLYYDHYWPYASLNYLSNWWPRYRYSLDDEDLSYRSLRMQRIFDDETRMIRAQSAALLKSIHLPVPRQRSYPITALNRYGEYPARLSNDHYINRLMQISPKNSKVQFVTYYTEPIKKYIGQGHLSCVSYVGDRGVHGRRRNVYIYEDPVKNDIQLLSFYINKFREEKKQKAIEPTKVPLSPIRPSRRFNSSKQLSDETPPEIKELREARAARLARINAEDTPSVEETLKEKKKREEARLAEEKALAEEQAAKEAQEARERKERAAKEAAERAAELERQAELLRQEELAKQAEIERARKEQEEQQRLEEERRLAEEAKAEEERKQLIRLQEIAKQAEEEREAELARQAEELAELARQEAELAEQAKREAEEADVARQEKELAEQKRLEQELAELERQELELVEAAEKAKQESEVAMQETEDEISPETIHYEESIEIADKQDDIVEGEAMNEVETPREEETIDEINKEDPEIQQVDEERDLEEEQQVEVTQEPLVDEPVAEAGIEEEEEPVAEAEDAPATQEDTADEAEDEEEE